MACTLLMQCFLIHQTGTLLSFLNSETNVLDEINSTDDIGQEEHRASWNLSTESHVRCALSAYEILLFVPIEYLSRTLRTAMTRRALIANTLFSVNDHNLQPYFTHSLTVLRVFLKRIILYGGAIDQEVRIFSVSCLTK